MNEKITIRRVYKATELKRLRELEGEYHHMGETHSGGDTMRVVFESESGEWLALVVWGSSVRIGARHGAEFFGDSVRGEWRVESYHARCDVTYFEDIRTRRCNENVICALMLARTMALYLFAKSGMEKLPEVPGGNATGS